INPKETNLYKILTLGELGPDMVSLSYNTFPFIISDGLIKSLKFANLGLEKGKNIFNKVKDVISSINGTDSSQTPAEPPPASGPIPAPRPPVTPPGTQHDEPFNTDILSSTLPVGISFALGSIALLFYMKKKPKITPMKLFRVLDIPQNDYGIPTSKSSNGYIPYGKYKGKTYIYVEGEETEDYVRDISSLDITSSSESEYEEMDINDIYPYKSPKYKTLIEVVLKPSTNNNVQDTYTDDVKDNSDTPINKLTDEEWNQLKQDFISQYLQNIQEDLPNENIIDDNIYKNIQPDIVDSGNPLEKPFITSIQDRFLDNHEKINYDIDW
ncbi:putative EMP1-like protein, partial [Plasmodium gaboni]